MLNTSHPPTSPTVTLWSGAEAFFIKDSNKRPVSAYADSKEVKNISSVKIESEDDIYYKLLFDKGHGLQERILREQFF